MVLCYGTQRKQIQPLCEVLQIIHLGPVMEHMQMPGAKISSTRTIALRLDCLLEILGIALDLPVG